MLLTEKEAGEKWCPHARCNNGLNMPATNRGHYKGENMFALCVGSRCTQWRWAETAVEDMTSHIRPEGDGWENQGSYKTLWQRERGPMRRGFCGIAGRPRVE